MKAIQYLHEIGHSLWLDNIKRGLLISVANQLLVEMEQSLVNSWKELIGCIVSKSGAIT